MNNLFQDWQPHRHKEEYLKLGQPLLTKSAEGAFVYADKEYIDFVMGWGTIVLGHANSNIAEIISSHLSEPLIVNNHTTIEVKVAELISNLYGNNFDVSFFTNGSDATSAAVRVARAFTGKKMVVFLGYHGWHDWAQPNASGVLKEVSKSAVQLIIRENIETLIENIKQKGEDLACVVLEMPVQIPQNRTFIQELYVLSQRYGFLIIFDEIKTTLRCGFIYGKSTYGVEPDIALFGKACGGGFPLSIMITRKKIGKHTTGTRLIGSYWGAPLPLYVFEYLFALFEDNDLAKKLKSGSLYFKKGLISVFSNQKLPIHVEGHPTMPRIHFSGKDINLNRFYNLCFKNGLYVRMPPHCLFTSLAHTKKIYDDALERFSMVAKKL